MSVPLSRALMNKGLKGEIVMMVLQNHQSMVAVYYGALFAGAIPFLVDSKNTMYEFSHFIALVCPSVIFCEESCSGDIIKVVNQWVGERPDIVIASSSTYLKQYTTGFSGDLDSFRVADVDLELPAVVLPTSGSTGLPKAAMLGHRGLVAQLPTLWTHHDQFPRPTDLVMLVSTSQWMTHTSVLTTCPVYQITLLMTPSPSVDGFLAMILQYKPTWTLLGPMFADTLAGTASSSDFTSFQTILTTGAQPTPMAMKTLKDKLSHNVHLCNGYGMTETHGFTTMPDMETPYQSCGRIVNIFDYKLVDKAGNRVGTNEKGELLLRSESCILQGYYRNKEALEECMTDDGWLKTGDVFYEDRNGLLYFVERNKFWFKYLNHQISPEELEVVIGNLPGVTDVHGVVNATLNENKRLHGGVVLVERLPRTQSGKLHRAQCRDLLNSLIAQRNTMDGD
ncbi:unnamed protein product, partial [Iphiclides podalirius]